MQLGRRPIKKLHGVKVTEVNQARDILNNDNEGDRRVNMHTSISAVEFFYCQTRIIICFPLRVRGRQEAPTYIKYSAKVQVGSASYMAKETVRWAGEDVDEDFL